MCCRFYTDDTTKKDIISLVSAYDRKINWLREGDVHPGDPATVITAAGAALYARDMRWSEIPNARAETVQTKKMFAESYEKRRCVIPAKWFYEWDREKNRVQFMVEGERSVYLAGIWHDSAEDPLQHDSAEGAVMEFSVVTVSPGESMKPVHDRQPLVLTEDEVRDWILDSGRAAELLQKLPVEFSLYREYEQLSLLDLL